jgi:hypothetical protein
LHCHLCRIDLHVRPVNLRSVHAEASVADDGQRMRARLLDLSTQQSCLARRYAVDDRAVYRVEMQFVRRRKVEVRPLDDAVLRCFDGCTA